MNRIKTHGHYRAHRASPTYAAWQAMKARVLYPKAKDAKNYRDRGISLDPRWLKFENFLEDMGCKPPDYQLDRIDNNGPYTKSNCRWICCARNIHNSRVSKLDWDKVSQIRHMWTEGFSQTEIARRFGICPSNVSYITRNKTWNKLEKPILKKEG